MKKFLKSFLVISLVVTLLFTSVACGKKAKDAPKEEAPTAKASNEKPDASDIDLPDDDPAPTVAPVVSKVDPSLPVFEADTLYTVESKGEFMLDYINITKDVLPPSPDSFYSHYEAEDGKVYVDVCVSYKNLETADVDADEVISAKLFYGEYYEYKGFSTIEEDNRGDFTYSSITQVAPLSTEYLHYLFEVPEELQDSAYSLICEITLKGEAYTITIKDGDKFENVKPAETKKSGEVETEEVITTKNGEFYLEYTNITADVLPPYPDSYYSHYEAEDGKMYIDVCICYKNLTGEGVDADEIMKGKVKYADTYEYTGFSMIEEESRSDFTYSSITEIAPLTTEYIHYLFQVPEEVSMSTDSLVVNFTVDNNAYSYKIR